jgi:cold shock CspA family protein
MGFVDKAELFCHREKFLFLRNPERNYPIIVCNSTGGHMAEKRCTIHLIVNGQRWLEEGEALVSQSGLPRGWSLGGLLDHVKIVVGAKLGFTFDAIDFAELRWCRAKSNAGDAEAVTAGFTIFTTPHVNNADVGAGLSLEAVDALCAAGGGGVTAAAKAVVTVGSQMTWMPLRQKLEARATELFELLLPATGKVLVSTERVVDLRNLAQQHHADDAAKALFKPVPVAAGASTSVDASASTAEGVSYAANAARGTVKSLANGYGMAKRKDGLPDVQFMATQVTAPGFEFLEVGDELRFDVAQVASGKWFAMRVVRM